MDNEWDGPGSNLGLGLVVHSAPWMARAWSWSCSGAAAKMDFKMSFLGMGLIYYVYERAPPSGSPVAQLLTLSCSSVSR
jgi:hypothetical protein